MRVALGDAVKKRAVTVLALLLAPLALYLLVVNVFLATPLLVKLVNKKPHKFFMTYDSAYSLWPGHVHVRGYHMVFQNHKLAFELHVADSTAHVRLTELLNRRFVAKKVIARGVTWKQMQKAPADQQKNPRVLAYPLLAAVIPVQGEQPPPRQPGTHHKLWSVQLDNVDSAFNEVWVMEYHWKGSGTARGSFEIRPMRSFWVGPVRTELQPGVLSVGGDVISSNFGGAGTLHIKPVNMVKENKLKMLSTFNLDGRFTGDIEGLKFLRAYGLAASGNGDLEIDVHITDGALADGTKVELDLPKVRARHGASGAGFKGTMKLRAWRGERPRLRVIARGDISVPLGNDQVMTADVPETKLELGLTTNEFVKAPRLSWFQVDAAELNAKDTAPLHAAMKGKVPFIVPALLGNGPLTAKGVQARGSAKHIRFKVKQATMGDTQVRGEMEMEDDDKPSGAFEAKVSTMPIGISVNDGKPAFQLLPKAGWLEDHLAVEAEKASGQRGADDQAGRDAPVTNGPANPSR